MVSALIGCVIGNFLYHAFTDRNWAHALEWSFAQAMLALAVFVSNLVVKAMAS
jgi:hypothetical protein